MTFIAMRLLLFVLVVCVSSRHVPPPSETEYHRGDIVAVPTTTPLARLPRDEVAPPLTNSATCGYTSGQWFSAVTCGDERSCTYYTEPYSAPNFGCCSSGLGCGYVSTCRDYGAYNNPHTGIGVLLADEEFLCGPDAPFCSTLLLYGQEYTSGGTYSFFSYGCQTGSGTKITAYQTTRGSSKSPSSTTSSTSSQDSSSSEDVSSRTASTTSPSATLAETTPTAASGGLSQGAEIGIGVGLGLVGAGAIIAASLWFWRRRVQRKDVPEAARFAHYGDTGYGYGGSPGGEHDFYATGSMRKQGQERLSPVELTSTPPRHELDGNDTR